MIERYNLSELLNEIKEEQRINLHSQKDTLVSQQGINELFAKNKKNNKQKIDKPSSNNTKSEVVDNNEK